MFLVFMDYPKSAIRLLCANEAIFLSSVSLLLDYKAPPIAPLSLSLLNIAVL